jgi:hypothetical protein
MIKSGEKLFIFAAICFLFIIAPCSYASAGEGSHAGAGGIMSGPVNEPGNKSVTRQIIREDEIRNENNMGEDIPYDDSPIVEGNDDAPDNAGMNDPIDRAEVNDPIDKAEKDDPIDREDSE